MGVSDGRCGSVPLPSAAGSGCGPWGSTARLDATSPNRAWKLQEHEDSSNDRREKPNDADDFLLGTSGATGVRIDSPDPPFKRISDILSDADKDNPHYYKPAKRFDGNGYREVRNIGGHAGQARPGATPRYRSRAPRWLLSPDRYRAHGQNTAPDRVACPAVAPPQLADRGREPCRFGQGSASGWRAW
jgi:hypothetical protein